MGDAAQSWPGPDAEELSGALLAWSCEAAEAIPSNQ